MPLAIGIVLATATDGADGAAGSGLEPCTFSEIYALSF